MYYMRNPVIALLLSLLILNTTSCSKEDELYISTVISETFYKTESTIDVLYDTTGRNICKENNLPTESEIMSYFQSATNLYCLADGISAEDYYNVDGIFYLDGNSEKNTLDDRINEFTDCFTKNKCTEIFNGKRKNSKAEYKVMSYGQKADYNIEELKAEDILGKNFSAYSKITLFSVVRGVNLSYAAGRLEIDKIDKQNISLKYRALYLGNHGDGIEYEIDCKNNDWVIVSPKEREGEIYSTYESDYIEEYDFLLTFENGKWKFDSFSLWY